MAWQRPGSKTSKPRARACPGTPAAPAPIFATATSVSATAVPALGVPSITTPRTHDGLPPIWLRQLRVTRPPMLCATMYTSTSPPLAYASTQPFSRAPAALTVPVPSNTPLLTAITRAPGSCVMRCAFMLLQ